MTRLFVISVKLIFLIQVLLMFGIFLFGKTAYSPVEGVEMQYFLAKKE